MENVERMPLLFSRDEVHAMVLAIEGYFKHLQAVRAGEEPDGDIDDEEIEDMLADGDAHIIDEAMLKEMARRLKGIKEPRIVNLMYLGWDEFCEVQVVVVLAISRGYEIVNRGRESPEIDDVREDAQLFALAVRFEKIYDENKK
jgi:hypothetical protein